MRTNIVLTLLLTGTIQSFWFSHALAAEPNPIPPENGSNEIVQPGQVVVRMRLIQVNSPDAKLPLPDPGPINAPQDQPANVADPVISLVDPNLHSLGLVLVDRTYPLELAGHRFEFKGKENAERISKPVPADPNPPVLEMISSPTIVSPIGQDASIVIGRQILLGAMQAKDGTIYVKIPEEIEYRDVGLEMSFNIEAANEQAVSFRNLRIKHHSFSLRRPITPVPFDGALEILSTQEHTMNLILPTTKMAVIQISASPRDRSLFAILTAQFSKE